MTKKVVTIKIGRNPLQRRAAPRPLRALPADSSIRRLVVAPAGGDELTMMVAMAMAMGVGSGVEVSQTACARA